MQVPAPSTCRCGRHRFGASWCPSSSDGAVRVTLSRHVVSQVCPVTLSAAARRRDAECDDHRRHPSGLEVGRAGQIRRGAPDRPRSPRQLVTDSCSGKHNGVATHMPGMPVSGSIAPGGLGGGAVWYSTGNCSPSACVLN